MANLKRSKGCPYLFYITILVRKFSGDNLFEPRFERNWNLPPAIFLREQTEYTECWTVHAFVGACTRARMKHKPDVRGQGHVTNRKTFNLRTEISLHN